MRRLQTIVLLAILGTSAAPTRAQTAPAPNPARQTPHTRDPNTPGYVTAKDLPDGTNAPATADGSKSSAPPTTPHPR